MTNDNFKYSENKEINMNIKHFILQTYIFQKGLEKRYLPQLEFPVYLFTHTDERIDIAWIKRQKKSGQYKIIALFEIDKEDKIVQNFNKLGNISLFFQKKPDIYSVGYNELKIEPSAYLEIKVVGIENGKEVSKLPFELPFNNLEEWTQITKYKWII